MEVTVLSFPGPIDAFPALIQTADGLVSAGTRRLALDLANLPFINSAALAWFVRLQKELAAKGGELALCRLEPAIENILSITQLDTLLPTFDTAEEAIGFLGGDPDEPADEPESMGGPLSRQSWHPRKP